jgi:hypothetical protein
MDGDGSAGAGARGRCDRSKAGDVLASAASMMQSRGENRASENGGKVVL